MNKRPPVIAQIGPYEVEIEDGKDYWWCSCGRSKDQPFCDGSHKGTGFRPVEYKCKERETVYFCGCKHTGAGPFCDNTHESL